MKNLLLLLILPGQLAIAQNRVFRDTSGLKQRDIIAAGALRELVAAIDEKNMNNFGFTSIEDARYATMGKPYQLYMVPVNKLKQYTAATPTTQMTEPTKRYLYPITNSRTGKLVNAMWVDNVRNKWRVVSYGKNKDVTAMAEKQSSGNSGRYFIVSIPAFSIDFVSYFEGSELMLIPITTDTKNKIESGRVYQARQVLATYAQSAKVYNGLPM